MSDDWHNAPNAEDKYDDYLDANGLMVCEICGDECPSCEYGNSCDDCARQRLFEDTEEEDCWKRIFEGTEEEEECLKRGLLAMVSDGWVSETLESYKGTEEEEQDHERK